MSYNINEIDGVRINPDTKRFPVEIHVEQHPINGPEHTGILDDGQIPLNIMRTNAHQSDPHTMTIDGRDVSADGAKLDTIESGAEVNNLSDMQAHDLTSGLHTNWHHHDNFYYRKTELQTSGSASVAWGNLTSVPSTFPSTPHLHDDRYYTETELNNGQLDNRYYTETEMDSALALKSDATHLHDGRYYLESEVDAFLLGKSNVGHFHDDRYFTESEVTTLLSGKSDTTHLHDDRYYTQSQVTAFLADKSDTTHLHDDRYYTESEIDSALALKSDATHLHDDRYYTESEVDDLLDLKSDATHLHDDRYYTETEINDFLDAKSDDGHFHDDRYFTESEVTTLLSGKSDTTHLHDDRYYTETEIDGLLLGKSNVGHFHDDRYYTETEMNSGQLDTRYYTEAEVDAMIHSASIGVKGAVDTFADLPSSGNVTGEIYIVKQTVGADEEGFYRWSGTAWIFLVNNTGVEVHNDLAGLNDGNYKHLSQAQYTGLVDGLDTILHQHDGRYYTESEIDSALALKSDATHIHDDRYYTETELNAGQLNTLYYTKLNCQTSGQAVVHWNNISNKPSSYTPSAHNQSATTITSGTLPIARGGTNAVAFTTGKIIFFNGTSFVSSPYAVSDLAFAVHNHDDLYYTESEIDSALALKSDATHLHDDRYFTESEITTSYYSKIELQTDGQSSVAWSNLTGVPASFVPVAHDHDDRYFTESEIDSALALKSDTSHLHDDRYYTETELNAGQLDNRYFTESEVTALLSDKSNVGHLHDDRYFTESEVTALLSDKSNVGHLHDDRYFTESEIATLLSGKSDTTHLHDDRYFTEAEIATLLSGKSDTTHLHDDRYYTESEIQSTVSGSSGALKVGVSAISGMVSTNVQSAIDELSTRIGSLSSTLDQAYEAGRTINADIGAVKIDTGSATTAGFELTNKSTAPTTGLAGGQMSVIDNTLYIYDGSRSKWLTPSKTFNCGKVGGTKNQYLRFPDAVVGSAGSGFIGPKNGTIISVAINSTTTGAGANGMLAYLRIDGITQATFTFAADGDVVANNLNVNFDAHNVVTILMGNNSTDMKNCLATVEYCWRL